MPSLIPLDNLLGASFIGVIVSTAMIDTLHVALVGYSMYYYTVTNFGDYTALVQESSGSGSDWSMTVCPLSSVYNVYLMSVFVQNLLNVFVQLQRREHSDPWHHCISANSLPLSSEILTRHPVYSMCGTTGLHVKMFSKIGETIPWIASALSTNMVCDGLIMSYMISYLKEGRTHFSRTNRAITLLITYALNTFLLTTILSTFAVATLITFLAMHDTLVYALFFFVLVRLHSCSFMSTLNSRDTVRQELDGVREVFALSNFAPASASSTAEDAGSMTPTGEMK
ncbi:hypothetical protein EW146_g4392 [Bondarzewia mesenterica]|uniref:DUF6534 domain-containing protein n=1 Tax=Bondarzewia mesenterica TaxID=1095465 RepID=A0A4S4LUQ4_9AGAM|nr:hypothetical protein EW146_g4392 [Bondarzewia mesenterica]